MSAFEPFNYHTPSEAQFEQLESFRNLAKAFRNQLVATLPATRERSLAITKIEEALMWANKAVFVPVSY